MDLASKRIDFEGPEQAVDYFLNAGWTDGLPVVPPTEEKVVQFLTAANLDPREILGAIPERNRIFTAEKVAINAVMAGCVPKYFPVVTTAIRAVCKPEFGLHGVSSSTSGMGLFLIINGPVVKQLGINARQNLFGPGNRANATIGRAVRLVMHNLGGKEFDRSCFGHPGKYTYCVAEDEDTLWEPLHVMRGLTRETSAVTVMAAEGPSQIQNHTAKKAEDILRTIGDRMRSFGGFNFSLVGDTECAVIIAREHYETLIAEGWEKSSIKEYLYEHASRPRADFKTGGVMEGPIVPEDRSIFLKAVSSPEKILLISGGGVAGRYSLFIPGYAGQGRAVTESMVASCSIG